MASQPQAVRRQVTVRSGRMILFVILNWKYQAIRAAIIAESQGDDANKMHVLDVAVRCLSAWHSFSPPSRSSNRIDYMLWRLQVRIASALSCNLHPRTPSPTNQCSSCCIGADPPVSVRPPFSANSGHYEVAEHTPCMWLATNPQSLERRRIVRSSRCVSTDAFGAIDLRRRALANVELLRNSWGRCNLICCQRRGLMVVQLSIEISA